MWETAATIMKKNLLQLVSLATSGHAQELMSQTNAEYGLDIFARRLQQSSQVVHSLGTLDGVPRAIAQKQAVVLALKGV